MSNKIILQAPEGTTSASFEGTEYRADKAGRIEVPAAAATHLAQFGFVNAPAEAAKPTKPAAKDAAPTKEGAPAEAAK